MKAFNGTPGPWAATKAKPRMVTASGVLICTAVLRNMGTPAQNKRGKGQEEAVANARLIAAAPDLLAELSKFAAKANGYDGVPPPKYFGDIDCELRYPDSLKIEFTLGELRAARKAIAAATGEGL